MEYNLYVSMPIPTAQSLEKGKYTLYLMRAVKASGTEGAEAAIWLSSPMWQALDKSEQAPAASFQKNINWHEAKYTMYTSKRKVPDVGKIITDTITYDADLGDQVRVTSTTAIGELEIGKGVSGSLVFTNDTSASGFSCGLSTMDSDGVEHPYNAFKFPGKQSVTLTPIIKILAFFSTDELDYGAVKERTNTSAALIDFTGANKPQRLVNFDFDKGWSGPSDWCQIIGSSEVVTSHLIIKG